MATVTANAGSMDTASGTKSAASISVNVGSLIVVVAANTGQTAQPTVTDNNPDGLGAYTVIPGTDALKNSSADKMFMFVRNALVGDVTATTVSMAPGATTGGGLRAFVITPMTFFGLSAIRAVGRQQNIASGTPAPSFPQAALTTNVCLGAVFNGTNPSTTTKPASWTSDVLTGYATPTTGWNACHRNSGETGSTITWAATSASPFCSVIVEVDVSAGVAVSDPTSWINERRTPRRRSLQRI